MTAALSFTNVEVVCSDCDGRGWSPKYVEVVEKVEVDYHMGFVFSRDSQTVTGVSTRSQKVCVPCDRCEGTGRYEAKAPAIR